LRPAIDTKNFIVREQKLVVSIARKHLQPNLTDGTNQRRQYADACGGNFDVHRAILQHVRDVGVDEGLRRSVPTMLASKTVQQEPSADWARESSAKAAANC
jgi:hypothetical protein